MNIYKTNSDSESDGERELTDEAFVIIDTTINAMAGRYRFGYHTIQDMRQQCWIFVLSQLYRYDGKRSLAAFVGTILITRSFNFKRDTYHRPQKPCLRCPLFEKATDTCLQFRNRDECEKYTKWRLLNDAKRNLHHFAPVECAASVTYKKPSHEEIFMNKELLDSLRAELTDEENLIVESYLRGDKIAKRKLSSVIARMKEVYDGFGIE